ncbi:OprO/OprP family phosphate-selective porin [Sphingopyxis sp. RIFCSPHIGHO2_12_FULL_65_19]|uniref:OprO/OprP family phosphate-selective porin n=1 Tax=Sphingopyxis sp. RIFCSPHIGHO2_12_FULL_65_19 TaxID=1802172 RepID=UPI0008AC7DC1|nr:porin [Sphingopyxis sp. RIFCSPHIGHO2_12_FULL_65_19]OHD10294.1 MAG: porin [Sphingopyxis sp. RIFCSPHIGHO2_12_FULL_65_19]
MRHALAAALLATSMFSLPTTAYAQAMSAEEAAALRAELASLRNKVEMLEARLDQGAPPSAGTAAPVPAPAPAPEPSATQIKWKGAPEIKTADGWSFKPRGRVQVDAAHVGAPGAIADPALGFSNELRRIRMGFGGTIPGGFGYKVEADFAESDVVLLDALMTYQDGPLKLTVGQHNTFQGLEELSSSNDTSFIERAAFTDAFNFIRRAGISAEYSTGALLLQGGVFTDNFTALDSGNDGYSFDGRVVYAPKVGKTQLHFGGSAHWRKLGDTVPTVRYRQRPLVHSADIRFVASPNMNAEAETGFGTEAAFIRGRLHGAAEAFWQSVDRPGLADPQFFGGSVEAGLFLTDDTRAYKDGIFKEIHVKNPVSDGGIGAWQINLRYDHLDLNDAGIVGGRQDGYMASLIWTPIDYVRFMVNYARLQYHDAVIPAGGDRNYGVDSIGARAQIVF